jgi:phosphatidylserine decarboxylase
MKRVEWHPEAVRIYNRYTSKEQTELIYGEWALRLCYGTALGRWATSQLVARAFISRFYGWWMRRPASVRRIRPFVAKYAVDESEFERPVEDYGSFNDFFCRRLKAGARPVDEAEDTVVFPADGRHFGWERLGEEQGVFVKGQKWDLRALLGDADLARAYAGGTLILSRLCPVDYHHFHYPVAGRFLERRTLSGRLFSVSPLALRVRLAYFWENYRRIELVESRNAVRVCLLDVGATNVGSIQYAEAVDPISKGAHRGWFEFGGSSVVTLFPAGTVALSDDLRASTEAGLELYAKAGDRMGHWLG